MSDYEGLSPAQHLDVMQNGQRRELIVRRDAVLAVGKDMTEGCQVWLAAFPGEWVLVLDHDRHFMDRWLSEE